MTEDDFYDLMQEKPSFFAKMVYVDYCDIGDVLEDKEKHMTDFYLSCLLNNEQTFHIRIKGNEEGYFVEVNKKAYPLQPHVAHCVLYSICKEMLLKNDKRFSYVCSEIMGRKIR